MSRLLDPMHRRLLDGLGVTPGARTLEVGCGNGSVSSWLAGRVGPGGRVVAVDLDLSLTASATFGQPWQTSSGAPLPAPRSW